MKKTLSIQQVVAILKEVAPEVKSSVIATAITNNSDIQISASSVAGHRAWAI